MKLATFQADGSTSWGVIADDVAIDTGAVLGARFADLRAVIAADAFAAVSDAMATAPRHAEADLAWLPVIPEPGKIFCVGLNYETHRQETGRTQVQYPTIFTRFANSQIG